MLCCEPDSEPIDNPPVTAALTADTLGESVLIFLAITVLQRLVGFVRGLVFCSWLSPEELGKWEMCFSFILFAAPVAILSLPGSFGRYLEYYRVRGHFRTFLRRTALATAVLAVASTSVVLVFREQFAEAIFGLPDCAELVGWLTAGLLAVIATNYMVELFTALRLQRISSRLQMIQTVGFALLGGGLLAWYPQGAQSVVMAYVGGSLVAFLAGVPHVWHAYHTTPRASEAAELSSFWRKLLPYAVSLWATNWLSNTFLMADRYLIVHYSGLSAEEALAQVGQYHVARLAPILMMTVAGMLASILLPHLSHEWETGRREIVSQRMNLFFKVLGLALLGVGAAVLLVAPLMFHLVFGDKYALGLAVLPWTLGYCVWAALGYVARTYLWCDEKVLLSSLAYAIGLTVSIALSLLLLPTYALFGAVWATAVGNAVVLVLLMLMTMWRGMEVQRGTWLVLTMPLALCFGAWTSTAVFLASLMLLCRSEHLLSQSEKQQLVDFARHYLARLKRSAGKDAPLGGA